MNKLNRIITALLLAPAMLLSGCENTPDELDTIIDVAWYTSNSDYDPYKLDEGSCLSFSNLSQGMEWCEYTITEGCHFMVDNYNENIEAELQIDSSKGLISKNLVETIYFPTEGQYKVAISAKFTEKVTSSDGEAIEAVLGDDGLWLWSRTFDVNVYGKIKSGLKILNEAGDVLFEFYKGDNKTGAITVVEGDKLTFVDQSAGMPDYCSFTIDGDSDVTPEDVEYERITKVLQFNTAGVYTEHSMSSRRRTPEADDEIEIPLKITVKSTDFSVKDDGLSLDIVEGESNTTSIIVESEREFAAKTSFPNSGGGFKITNGGKSCTPKSVALHATDHHKLVVSFTSEDAITNSSDIKISYTPFNTPILDINGGALKAFDAKAVTVRVVEALKTGYKITDADGADVISCAAGAIDPSAETIEIKTGDTLTFADQSTGGTDTVVWSVDGGTAGENGVYTFNTAGTFTTFTQKVTRVSPAAEVTRTIPLTVVVKMSPFDLTATNSYVNIAASSTTKILYVNTTATLASLPANVKDDFVVKAGEATLGIASVETTDIATQLKITLSEDVYYNDIITCTYTGDDLQSTDGKILSKDSSCAVEVKGYDDLLDNVVYSVDWNSNTASNKFMPRTNNWIIVSEGSDDPKDRITIALQPAGLEEGVKSLSLKKSSKETLSSVFIAPSAGESGAGTYGIVANVPKGKYVILHQLFKETTGDNDVVEDASAGYTIKSCSEYNAATKATIDSDKLCPITLQSGEATNTWVTREIPVEYASNQTNLVLGVYIDQYDTYFSKGGYTLYIDNIKLVKIRD